MKTLKFALPVLALLFAIVAAFATNKKVVTSPGFIQDGSVTATFAIPSQSTLCDNSTSNICKFRKSISDPYMPVYSAVINDGLGVTRPNSAVLFHTNGTIN